MGGVIGVRSTARELRGQPRRFVSEKKVGFIYDGSQKNLCVLFCFVFFRSLSLSL